MYMLLSLSYLLSTAVGLKGTDALPLTAKV